VRIWSFDKFNAESSLYTPAMETRIPVAAARSVAHPGKLPPAQAGITLSRKGVAVSAFGPNPDGKGIVLRVWEQGGTTGELTVTLPGKFATATPVTLRGEKTGDPLKIAEGKFTFPLKAYAPASFVLE
jgi:alpha-mannosidase